MFVALNSSQWRTRNILLDFLESLHKSWINFFWSISTGRLEIISTDLSGLIWVKKIRSSSPIFGYKFCILLIEDVIKGLIIVPIYLFKIPLKEGLLKVSLAWKNSLIILIALLNDCLNPFKTLPLVISFIEGIKSWE